MSPVNCKYHPLIPARWACSDCAIHFCGDCVSKDSIKNRARCPLCKTAAQQIDAANFIVPFWKRIPSFFLYPANSSSLLFIGFIAILLSISSLGGIFGLVISFICFLLFLRYALAVLSDAANGSSKPTEFSADLISQGFLLPVKQILVFAGLGWIIWQEAKRGQIGLIRFTFYSSMFLFPAQIMILATEESLFKSINPLRWIELLKNIGLSYLLLFLFLVMVSTSAIYVQGYIGQQDIMFLGLIQNFVGLYFFLIMFNMMGYVIYQYHEQLNYPIHMHVDEEMESHQRRKGNNHNPALAEIEVLIKEGRLDDAIFSLKSKLGQDPANAEYAILYFNLLKQSGNSQALCRYAQGYMNRLYESGNKPRAAQVLRECLAIEPTYKPDNPDLYFDLISNLRLQMAFKEAIALSSNFHKKYPHHPDLPKLYFEVAQMLSENMNNDAQAQKILEYLLKAHHQCDIYAQVLEYQNIISKIRHQGAV